MSEKNDVLVQVDHLKKYFPVKGLKGPGVQAVEDIPDVVKPLWAVRSFSCTSRLPEKLFTMVRQFSRDRIRGREMQKDSYIM